MLEIEQKTINITKETLSSLGYNIVLVKYTGTATKTLQVLIEKQDDTRINVDDCRIASNHISAILDVEDTIKEKYYLEVSSAGIERPLVSLNDFVRFANNTVIIRLKEALNQRKTYKGKLIGIDEETVKIDDFDSKKLIEINFHNIKSSNIVLTDELYRKILNKAN